MKKILFFILVIVLIGCDDGVSEKQILSTIEKDKTILAFTCEGYGKHNTPLGDLQNNIWNVLSAAEFDWTQCLAMRTMGANTQYGWYWQWPKEGNNVYAQPQITLGNSPWLQHSQIKSGYPISVNQLNKLDIDYSLEILTDGELNIATTLWLTHSDTIQTEVDTSTIAAEVTIWTFASDNFHTNTTSEKIGEINVNGIGWEVWLDERSHNTPDEGEHYWVYLAFRSLQSLKQVKFDAVEMLLHGVEQKLISPDLYIADIQLGTEIMSGTGQVWVNHYQVDVGSTDQ